MTSMKDRLSVEQLLSRMLSSMPVDALLETLQIQLPLQPPPMDDNRERGQVLFGVEEQALGVFDLKLIPPSGINPARDYLLSFDGPAGARTGFRLAVSLEEGPVPRPLFNLLRKLPSHGLVAARLSADGQSLEADPGAGDVQIVGLGIFLVLQGQIGDSIGLRLSSNLEAPDDVVVLAVQPPTVLLGETGFGLEFSHGLVFDFADNAGPADPVQVGGIVLSTPADAPTWQGVAANRVRFFLPKGVPFLGGHPVDAWLQIGLPPTPGIDLIVQTQVPAEGDRPAIDVRIECRDPTATGLDGFVPTLVEAVMDLPLKGRVGDIAPGKSFTFAAGVPVRARVRYARKPGGAGTAPSSELSLALESQGPDGILKTDSGAGDLGAKIAVTAATLATALVADGAEQVDAPDKDGSGVVLHTLLVAAVGLSSFLERGELVLHGAELITTGGVIPAGKAMRLKIDYSVAATVTGIDIGVMSVKMSPNQPLRVRVREVVLSFFPEKSGLEMIHLDYSRSSMEVEDPGGWKVHGPDSLFDVLGTRSGRGSMWIEVDLRFKLDLGPVKVSGATIRATLGDDGKLNGSLRGLAASIALDPMISGDGAVGLTVDGFHAALQAHILPLGNIGAMADVETAADMVKLALGVDLPGPLPLANSGLAIYGLGGVFAANGRPKPVQPGADPVQAALDWDYTEQGAFVPAPAFSFGLEAVIGTAADLGFTFSARAGLFVTTPDIVVRGSVEGRYMGPRMKIARGGNELSVLQAKGVILVDPADGVTVAVEGTYEIPHIVVTTVPVGAHFPTHSANWFIHLGSDGWTPSSGPSESRERGPVRSVFLPDIVGQESDAYLMMRGNGITNWPRNGSYTAAPGSFVIAFGVGFDIVYGLKPVLWADVFARADILVATNPMSFVGMGTVGGGLHIGPFSVGIDATVFVVLVSGQPPHLKAELCGSIDLFFDEIRKCVTLEYGSPSSPDMPEPSEHPLDGLQSLVDDRYRRLAPLTRKIEDATAENAVWPDSIPLLTFSSAPTLSLATAQFPDIARYPTGLRARPLGSDLLSYEWSFVGLNLIDATAGDVVVAGAFSNAWQTGKMGDAGGQPQPAELALMTPSGDLWLHALGDAGNSLQPSPLAALADICHAQATARLGWALGASATDEGDGYRLPPDPRSADPVQSQIRAHVQLSLLATPAQPARVLSRQTAQLLPLQYAYAGPRVHAFVPRALDGREFGAWLDPGTTLLPPSNAFLLRVSPLQQLLIAPEDPLVQARVWLVFDADLWTANAAGVRPFSVSDNLGQAWLHDREADLGDGLVAVRWLPPGPGFVDRIQARSPAGVRIGLLALGGITRSAAAAADQRNAATAAEAVKQDNATRAGPPDANAAPAADRRCVLEPGRLYRIDVRMRWSGTLWRMDDQNKKQVVASKAAGDDTESTRQFWFRTSPLQPAGGTGPGGGKAHFWFLHRRQDLFDPAMLERHLLGYEPAQSELQRFAHDPVKVRFSVGHVALLAGAYKFDLLCALRRLDQPEAVEADQFLVPSLTWATSTAQMHVSDAVIAQAYIASACGLAPNAVDLLAKPMLTRDTWYEVFVLAKSQREGVMDGRLPGVSFRTSRWADGEEMMQSLHFPISGVGHADGGIALPPDTMLKPQVSEGDDGAFDAFLTSLGLEGWPAASEPRASLVWLPPIAPNLSWRCAGLMLESPEAIHRPMRFEVIELQLVMGAAKIDFNVRWRDRSGSRLLIAASLPFVPRLTRRGRLQPLKPMLRLRCNDMPLDGAARVLQGLLELPLQPSFAEEAQ